MNLKLLSKTELDHHLKDLVKNERRILHEILLTIKEIDQRKTFQELGFASLFSYLVEGVGYSAGSAQRRIEAARLLKQIPELGEKLQSGELKLTQISLIQKASREAERTSNVEVSLEDKKELLDKLAGKSFELSQKEVASFFDLPIQQATKKSLQSDGSVRLELTLSKELHEKLLRAQALVSHAVPSSELTHFLEYVSDKIIRQKTQTRLAARNTSNVEVEANTTKEAPLEICNKSTDFRMRDKKILLNRTQGCEYRHPMTNKVCGSHWFLQIDHKQSRWAGGEASLNNAQVLCGAHNRLKYHQEAGLGFRS